MIVPCPIPVRIAALTAGVAGPGVAAIPLRVLVAAWAISPLRFWAHGIYPSCRPLLRRALRAQRPTPIAREGTCTLRGSARRCPPLPHPLGCSTIGAGGLSFRVRNVAGRFPSAMATVAPRLPLLCCSPSGVVGGWVFVC